MNVALRADETGQRTNLRQRAKAAFSKENPKRKRHILIAVAVLVAIVAPLVLAGYFELGIALVALASIIVLVQRIRWLGVAVTVVTAVLVGRGVQDYTEGVRVMGRDFYGVVRTVDHEFPVPYRSMYHGGIIHGGQLLGDSFLNTPAD